MTRRSSMRTLYLDCFSGISGDMMTAALLDLGASRQHLQKELSRLGLADGYRLRVTRGRQAGITGLKFEVKVHETARRRHPLHSREATLDGIRRRIEHSKLSSFVRQHAVSLFHRIAVAEGRIHGVPVEKVHFHEVGAMDSIVDLVGVCILLESLAPQQTLASVPCDGRGTIECEHGSLPVPVPATLELLKGIPIRQISIEGELITPTGAAILAEFAQGFGPMPVMTVRKIGYGLGGRRYANHPNVLRVLMGDAPEIPHHADGEAVDVIETNVDDASPELLGDAMESLLAAGALDVCLVPAVMKKGRLATLVTVLAHPQDTSRLAHLLLETTGSFGLRVHPSSRLCLERETRRVRTALGIVEVKIGRMNGRTISAKPEFESCRKLARMIKKPLRQVWAMAAAECAGWLRNAATKPPRRTKIKLFHPPSKTRRPL